MTFNFTNSDSNLDLKTQAVCYYWQSSLKNPKFEDLTIKGKNSQPQKINYIEIKLADYQKLKITSQLPLSLAKTLYPEIKLPSNFSQPIGHQFNKTQEQHDKNLSSREKETFIFNINLDKTKEFIKRFFCFIKGEQEVSLELVEEKMIESHFEKKPQEETAIIAWGFFSSNSSNPLLLLEVTVDLDTGNFKLKLDSIPLINHSFFDSPNESNQNTFGDFERVLQFQQENSYPQTDNMNDGLNYAEDFLANVCQSDNFTEVSHPNSYYEKAKGSKWKISIRLYEYKPPSKDFSLIDLYQQILQESTTPVLLTNLCNPAQPNSVLDLNLKAKIAHLKENGHCGHMDSQYPLDATQRLGVIHFLETPLGKIQAINGPPGTGKTSMLKGVIASLFAAPLLSNEKNPNPPLILASSATNQAVTNIIGSFAKFADKSNSPTVASRWLTIETEDEILTLAPSFGWFFPSGSKHQDSSIHKYQILVLNRGKLNYEKAAKKLSQLKDKKESLIKNYINNFRQVFPSIQIELELDIIINRIREEVKLIRNLQLQANKLLFEIQDISQFIQYKQKLNRDLRAYSLNVEKASQELEELSTAFSSYHSHKTSLSLHNVIEQFERFCDITYRVYSFHLAARYWEGRWLLADDPNNSKIPLKPEKKRIQELQQACMIAPIIVATAYTLPKLFAFSKQIEQNTYINSYLFSEADLLIIDEAGQVLPEIAGALFALAKRALIVGDTYQLSPISSFTPLADQALLHRLGLLNYFQEFTEYGFLVSSGSLMKIAQQVTYYSEEGVTQKGILLRRHYRCYSEIIEFCNELVYQGQLIPFRKRAKEEKLVFGNPLLYVGHQHQATKINGSWGNYQEAKNIAQWLSDNRKYLEEFYLNQEHDLATIVAIVTPYVPQKAILEQELKQLLGDDLGKGDLEIRAYNQSLPEGQELLPEKTLVERMTIGTVHALQGAERSIIIFSPVVQRQQGEALFFDHDTSMLNVAISRAKDCFILIGHETTFFPKFNSSPVLDHPSSKLGRYLKKRGKRLYPRMCVVVESPNKAMKLQTLLGRDFQVFATKGHFQELIPNGRGVNIEQNFEPYWQIAPERENFLSEIGIMLEDADELILATDDDREGEEISRQVLNCLENQMPLDHLKISRVRLRGMSAKEIERSFLERGDLIEPLAEAARTRRILDYLIGGLLFEVLKEDADLWSGSGRVQAAILALLAQREQVIEQLRAKTKWRVKTLNHGVKIISKGEENITQFTFESYLAANGNKDISYFLSYEEAQEYVQQLRGKSLEIIGNKEITSYTLGQSPSLSTAEMIRRASERLGLSPDETMRLLQRLYEGPVNE